MDAVTLSPNGLDRYELGGPPERVLVATMDGVVELRLAGRQWSVAERHLLGVHVSCLLADAEGDAVYAGSHGRGIFRCRADGAWTAAANGLTSENVFSLASAEHDGRVVLYAGTEPALLFRSSDGAGSWEELTALRSIPGREHWDFPAAPNVAHTKHIDVDPRDPNTFYVSIEQGALLKTEDGGRSFRELAFSDPTYTYNKDAHRVVINPRDPDELYLSGGDGIAHSRDGGETWERVATPSMRVGYPDATFCSPAEDGVVFTSGAGGTPGTWRKTGHAHAAFARSSDYGRTWETLSLPEQPGNIEAATLVTWPEDYGFFAGTTDGDVFVSLDRGETWSQIASGLPPVSKCIHARNVLIGRGAA
jgi:photosystem II stability/assembly factor-like uncharacterized protein